MQSKMHKKGFTRRIQPRRTVLILLKGASWELYEMDIWVLYDVGLNLQIQHSTVVPWTQNIFNSPKEAITNALSTNKKQRQKGFSRSNTKTLIILSVCNIVKLTQKRINNSNSSCCWTVPAAQQCNESYFFYSDFPLWMTLLEKNTLYISLEIDDVIKISYL